MSNESADDLRKTFLFTRGRTTEDALVDLLSLVRPQYHTVVREALDTGVSTCLLVEVAASGIALASIYPDAQDVCCDLIGLDNLRVPAELNQRLLGEHGEQVHDMCNDLSAARLNGELALHLLERDDGKAGPEVVAALQALVRATVAVEAGLRQLEAGVELKLTLSYQVV